MSWLEPGGYDQRMTAAPRAPLLKRVSPGAWLALLWCVAIVNTLGEPLRGLLIGHRSQSAALWAGFGLADAVSLAQAAVMVLAACLVRRRPLWALALLCAGALVLALVPPRLDATDLPVLPLCLAVGFTAAARPLRASAAAAVVAFGALVTRRDMWIPPGARAAISPGLVIALVLAVSWLIGRVLRQNRIYNEATREQAIITERLRIARELHDLVAHSIGVIAIQAGAGRRVIDARPGEARDALAAIEATSRQTLAGLRRMLGGLRRSGPDPAAPPLGPAPGLADLTALATSASGAGVRVEMRWRGQPRPLPPEVDLSAFRIIQEAVTNVIRHAGASHCQVIIDPRDEDLAIEVLDDGCGGGVTGAGYGIAGMRERASLLHGDLSAGPRPGGGFRVAARLPLPARAR